MTVSIHDQLSELRRQQAETARRIAELEAEANLGVTGIKTDDYVKITRSMTAEGEYARYVLYDGYAFYPHQVVLIPSGDVLNVMSVEPATAAEVAEYLRKVADSLT